MNQFIVVSAVFAVFGLLWFVWSRSPGKVTMCMAIIAAAHTLGVMALQNSYTKDILREYERVIQLEEAAPSQVYAVQSYTAPWFVDVHPIANGGVYQQTRVTTAVREPFDFLLRVRANTGVWGQQESSRQALSQVFTYRSPPVLLLR